MNHMTGIKFQNLTKLSLKYNRFENQLHDFSQLYHALKRFYKFRRNFIFNTPILMILNMNNSAKILLKANTDMQHMVMMSEKFLFKVGLD